MSYLHRGIEVEINDRDGWHEYNYECGHFHYIRKQWKQLPLVNDSFSCMCCRAYLDKEINYKPELKQVSVIRGASLIYSERGAPFTQFDLAMNNYYRFWSRRKVWRRQSKEHISALAKQLGYEVVEYIP